VGLGNPPNPTYTIRIKLIKNKIKSIKNILKGKDCSAFYPYILTLAVLSLCLWRCRKAARQQGVGLAGGKSSRYWLAAGGAASSQLAAGRAYQLQQLSGL